MKSLKHLLDEYRGAIFDQATTHERGDSEQADGFEGYAKDLRKLINQQIQRSIDYAKNGLDYTKGNAESPLVVPRIRLGRIHENLAGTRAYTNVTRRIKHSPHGFIPTPEDKRRCLQCGLTKGVGRHPEHRGETIARNDPRV